jgi:hypothetical protein
MPQIASVEKLIEELGGPSATAKLLGTSPQNVVNWRNAKKIPARFHRAHKAKLRERRITVSDDLWGFLPVGELAAGGS